MPVRISAQIVSCVQTLDYTRHDPTSWYLLCGGIRLRAAPQVRVCAVYSRYQYDSDWSYEDNDDFMLYQANEHVSGGLLQPCITMTRLCHT
jgi:hypothetical protein